jgi:hypothetical protein
MAQITGQAGVNLTSELAAYLQSSNGNITTEQLSNLINQYVTGGDKLAAQGGSITTGIYKRFGEFDQITGKVEIVTTGLWSGDVGSLKYFSTSSAAGIVQSIATGSNLDYYVNVYESGSNDIQFAIAYGHKEGSGSRTFTEYDNATYASKATYAQYRSILLDQGDEYFTFASSSNAGHDSDDIYVINVGRARYKETMDAGNWQLTLSGSNGTFTFIDDSGKKFTDTAGKTGRVFYVASGSLNLGTQNDATIKALYSSGSAAGQGFGLFYPDQGLMVLNPQAIGVTVGNVPLGGLSGSLSNATEQRNHIKLLQSIVGGASFEARRTENVSTSHYFVRATNREFNFSNNPTFVSGSDGSFSEPSFQNDPRTFITTIGLYNDANELLAVAKTSQPIAKSYDKEVLIAVKLDF